MYNAKYTNLDCRVITIMCYECGCEYKVIIHNNKYSFYYLDKPMFINKDFKKYGIFKCIECKKEFKGMRFE